MKCPKCGEDSICYRTVDKYPLIGVKRYRKCKKCGYHFKTEEEIHPDSKEDAKAMIKNMMKRVENYGI